jgi:asparagine synthase (glutamine-hydrolysing)
MCGIAGFIDRTVRDLEGTCAAMTATLTHRGPDDGGCFTQRDSGVALGHRRLSILELTAAGHQPMTSASGRFTVVYNGEIYNHLAIRDELDFQPGGAQAWRGHSDTETLLAAVEVWGLRETLRRCCGMFALALWDRQRRVLSLARDRAGEKPLYYGRCGTAFLFGSELKALQAHPAFDAQVDRGSLALLLQHCYVPEPLSIFHGIRRLPPGSTLEIAANGEHQEPAAYWSFVHVAAAGRCDPLRGDHTAALDALERVLSAAVAGQMVADVPLGAFLSGGVDSSLVVALMQRQSGSRVRTFTIGFSEREYDESPHARAVAQHLGTDHTELIVTPAQAMSVIPRLATIYDEPFADSSQIPTFLVAQLARAHVTVSLSGDGGDELFGGYNRYAWAKRVWTATRALGPLRSAAARGIRALPPEAWARMFDYCRPLIPRRWRASNAGDRLHKAAELLCASQEEIYRALISHWPVPAELIAGGVAPASPITALMAQHAQGSFEERMMLWDFLTYLPGDILVKVDRAAMAVSLETRVPMLDHRVIEFACSLPLALRVRAGEGKWLLKRLLARYVPSALTDRPKTGFGIPIDTWLRGPLREWAEALLEDSRLRRDGFFNPEPIRRKWQEHLSGRRNWAYWLWDVLMFQGWWDEQQRLRPMARHRPPPGLARNAG